MNDARDLLLQTYRLFNQRDLDGMLALLALDVDWPNDWEGGRGQGQAGVRDYWTRQWQAVDPQVEPVSFETDAAGRIVVNVHQVVRDKQGVILSDSMVKHTYVLENGLIRRMDIGLETPFVCNMNAMNATQRQRYSVLTQQLIVTRREIRELPEGYAFRLAVDSSALKDVAQWVSYERLCCPFFAFGIDVEPDNGSVWLRLTGREGVKAFIKMEFGF